MLRISATCLGYGLALALVLPMAGAQAHDTLKVLYNFAGGPDTDNPSSGLIADKSGNYYGTGLYGGGGCGVGCGTVYELAPDGTETILHTFSGAGDGTFPFGALLADGAGNFYATTTDGGADNRGTIYKIAAGGAETVLYSFTGGSDGSSPHGAFIADKKGNMYSTALYGGVEGCASGCGTIFELAANGSVSTLYAFKGGAEGANPYSTLLSDKSGNLYGTTFDAGNAGCTGNAGCGTVFRLAPDGTLTTLYAFKGGSGDGGNPRSSLIADKAGNFYGTTTLGGASGCGTVFKLAPNGTETLLYSFSGGSSCSGPLSALVADRKGNFYGTTLKDGADGKGTVFRLAPDGTAKVLHDFTGGADGGNPYGALLLQGKTLVSTTYAGGTHGVGTVFELKE